MTDDASLCECHLPPFCDYCQREVQRVRGSIRICPECFGEWYDGCGSTDPLIIGNYVRRKHGLPALEPKP
jgi:Zn-finger nucleic acid-binding protein